MKYIVNNKEVSRDTFYFCQKAKEEHKTFVLLNSNKDAGNYINNRPEYDYYVYDEMKTYYTKGEATVTEWFEKWFEKDDSTYYSKCNLEDLAKRYKKSKLKDTMTLKEWYTKNGWKYHSETEYESEYHDIPTVGNFKEKEVKIKLFSIKVGNEETVQTINKIKDEYGDCIEYVLRDNNFTEIIYRDAYKELEE